MKNEYKSLEEFYPFYLSQHSNNLNRLLHYTGTLLVIAIFTIGLLTQHLGLLAWTPICGYGFAWFGHFFFEKNKPATFKYPLFSLACDFLMLFVFLSGKIQKRYNDFKLNNVKIILLDFI